MTAGRPKAKRTVIAESIGAELGISVRTVKHACLDRPMTPLAKKVLANALKSQCANIRRGKEARCQKLPA
jgi:hypothetical protein